MGDWRVDYTPSTTKFQRQERVMEAIKRAKSPMACKYLDEDGKTPLCPVAQLYVLEGGDPEKMKTWVTSRYGPVAAARVQALNTEDEHQDFNRLKDYNLDLLGGLQGAWDREPKSIHPDDAISEDQRRSEMTLMASRESYWKDKE